MEQTTKLKDSPVRSRWSLRYTQALLLLLVLVLFGACATDQKKPSPISAKVSQIQKNLSKLSVFYGKKDHNGFFEGLDSTSDSLSLVQSRMINDFEYFRSAEISFILNQVKVESKRIKTVVRWKGTWIQTIGQASTQKQGKAIFFWDDSSDPKMLEILGNSPFSVFR